METTTRTVTHAFKSFETVPNRPDLRAFNDITFKRSTVETFDTITGLFSGRIKNSAMIDDTGRVLRAFFVETVHGSALLGVITTQHSRGYRPAFWINRNALHAAIRLGYEVGSDHEHSLALLTSIIKTMTLERIVVFN